MDDDSVLISTVAPSTLERVHRSETSGQPLINLLADGSFIGPGLTLRTAASIALSDEGILYSTSLGDALYNILAFNLASGERWLVTGSNRLEVAGWENPYERGEDPKLTSIAEIGVGLDGYLYATTTAGVLRIDSVSGDRESVADLSGLSGLAVVPIPEPSCLQGVILLTLHSIRRTRPC